MRAATVQRSSPEKTARPDTNAVDLAASVGIELLTEAEYRALQRLGAFDTTTSSWLKTPPTIRTLGGALCGDRRCDHVLVYHNGASSYYAVRGFRGSLRVALPPATPKTRTTF